MQTMRVISRNLQSYGTRRLRAGDIFEAKDQDVKILRQFRFAELVPPAVDHVRENPEPGLREIYEDLTGKKPDGRWSDRRLRDEIDKFQGT